MGKLNPFKSPSKPDTSALEAQEARLAAEEKKLAQDEADRTRKEQATKKARSGRGGSRSLLSGLETGVSSEGEKRGNLG